jgi:putative colanic acid biosynthesis acetyltransferase WcaF
MPIAKSLSEEQCLVDLSKPDNSDYVKSRSSFVWAIWHFLGAPLLRSNLLPISALKCIVLRLFGAKVGRGVYIKPGVNVKFPWHLEIGDYCWVGEGAWIDNLAPVTIGSHVCISQGVYLCTGNHDWKSPNMKLFLRPIILQNGCWIGAKATICPGVKVSTGSVIAVGSVLTKDIPSYQVWAGNPAHYVRDRIVNSQS